MGRGQLPELEPTQGKERGAPALAVKALGSVAPKQSRSRALRVAQKAASLPALYFQNSLFFFFPILCLPEEAEMRS